MLKKQTPMRKKHVVFFIIFSSIFRENSSKNQAKRMKTIIVHTNQQKTHAWTALFWQKKRFFVNFWGPPGSPGASRDEPGNSQNRVSQKTREINIKNTKSRNPPWSAMGGATLNKVK